MREHDLIVVAQYPDLVLQRDLVGRSCEHAWHFVLDWVNGIELDILLDPVAEQSGLGTRFLDFALKVRHLVEGRKTPSPAIEGANVPADRRAARDLVDVLASEAYIGAFRFLDADLTVLGAALL